jgi:hypothetical protein
VEKVAKVKLEKLTTKTEELKGDRICRKNIILNAKLKVSAKLP